MPTFLRGNFNAAIKVRRRNISVVIGNDISRFAAELPLNGRDIKVNTSSLYRHEFKFAQTQDFIRADEKLALWPFVFS